MTSVSLLAKMGLQSMITLRLFILLCLGANTISIPLDDFYGFDDSSPEPDSTIGNGPDNSRCTSLNQVYFFYGQDQIFLTVSALVIIISYS